MPEEGVPQDPAPAHCSAARLATPYQAVRDFPKGTRTWSLSRRSH